MQNRPAGDHPAPWFPYFHLAVFLPPHPLRRVLPCSVFVLDSGAVRAEPEAFHIHDNLTPSIAAYPDFDRTLRVHWPPPLSDWMMRFWSRSSFDTQALCEIVTGLPARAFIASSTLVRFSGDMLASASGESGLPTFGQQSGRRLVEVHASPSRRQALSCWP
jgi:hypothetical protein